MSDTSICKDGFAFKTLSFAVPIVGLFSGGYFCFRNYCSYSELKKSDDPVMAQACAKEARTYAATLIVQAVFLTALSFLMFHLDPSFYGDISSQGTYFCLEQCFDLSLLIFSCFLVWRLHLNAENLEKSKWYRTKKGEAYLRSEEGIAFLMSEESEEIRNSEFGKKWIENNLEAVLRNSTGWKWFKENHLNKQSELGLKYLENEKGFIFLDSKEGHEWLDSPSGRLWCIKWHRWFETESAIDWLKTEKGIETVLFFSKKLSTAQELAKLESERLNLTYVEPINNKFFEEPKTHFAKWIDKQDEWFVTPAGVQFLASPLFKKLEKIGGSFTKFKNFNPDIGHLV